LDLFLFLLGREIQFLIQTAGRRETVGSLDQVRRERWEHFPEAGEDHVTQVDSSLVLKRRWPRVVLNLKLGIEPPVASTKEH
jgi:hypothetical protein